MAITFDPDVGFSVDSTSVIRQSIVDDWTAIFDDENATLNTSSESPAGQIIDSIAVLTTAKDSEFLYLANQFDPRVSEGRFQDAIGAIYFLERKTAQPSIVECMCTGLQGTVIPAGSIIQTDDGIKLQSVGSATIGATGTENVEFETLEKAPIQIGAGTCNKIITVIAGWDTVTNATAGTPGQYIENRAAFENRRYLSVAANSHGSRLSLQGALYTIDGVIDCLVLENKTDVTVTKQGVPLISHSVGICIYGGDDDKIAEMIYNKLDAGCGTNGGTSVTYTSEDSAENTYQIIRPTPTNIYISVTLNQTPKTLQSVVDDVKNAIYNDFLGNDKNSNNLRRGCGQTIYASSFSVATIKTAGVTDLVSIYIGRTSSPLDNSVTMDADEEPILDINNITVTVIPM